MSRSHLLRCAFPFAVMWMTACTGTGTALLIAVDLSQVPETQQLQFQGRVGARQVFGPLARPEQARGALERHQTLRVLLPDELADQMVTVSVDGLSNGSVHSHAVAQVQIVGGQEVRVDIVLAPAAVVCADCDGCCAEGRCVGTSVAACGVGGVSCIACDPLLADRCSFTGRCACGEGPTCSPERGADRCVGGQCQCGAGPACGAGLQCDNGVCRCTATSCAGCCSGNQCLSGDTSQACGGRGATCVKCQSNSVCVEGACAAEP